MELMRKILALAPVLPAIVLVLCMSVSLSGYSMPVYAVEDLQGDLSQEAEEDTSEKEEKTSSKKESEDQPEEEESNLEKNTFDKPNGTYQGTGTGYKGKITVAVTIKDKQITAIDIVSNEADDEPFFTNAKGVIDKIISAQNLDVDVVSGATCSSKGIINAVKNAITGEEDNSETGASASGAAAGGAAQGASPSVSRVEDAGEYKDGTYTGTGTGFGGSLTVQVVISGGKISSIDVVSHQDGDSYMNSAKSLIPNIISSQSTNVDTIAGATYSSAGIIEAVRDALSKAAVSSSGNSNSDSKKNNSSSNSNKKKATPTPSKKGNFPYKNGTYKGSAEGFSGTINVAVKIKDKTITKITVTKSSDDEPFITNAKSVIDKIISGQKVNVDVVSGATYSSRGIINAVKNALEAAKRATDGTTPTPTPKATATPTPTPSNPGQFPYKNGTYSGTAEGYNDDITVAVQIKDKTITKITVTKSEDDEAFFNRAKKVIDDIISKQTTEVDVVSGATYSSRGIINAVKEALKTAENATNPTPTITPTPEVTGTPTPTPTGEPEVTPTPTGEPEVTPTPTGEPEVTPTPTGEPEVTPTPTPEVTETPSVYKDGTYRITVLCAADEYEDFDDYQLSGSVTIANDKIVSIEGLSGDGGSGNDRYIGWAANGRSGSAGVVTQIVSKGVPEGIDTVSRATCSSNSIIEMARKALEAAKR